MIKVINLKYGFLFISLFMFASCITVKPLEYRSIEKLEITKMTPVTEYKTEVKLYNPNPVGVKIKEIQMQVKVFDNWMNINIDDPKKIPAQRDFVLPLTGTTTPGNVAGFIGSGLTALLSTTKKEIDRKSVV